MCEWGIMGNVTINSYGFIISVTKRRDCVNGRHKITQLVMLYADNLRHSSVQKQLWLSLTHISQRYLCTITLTILTHFYKVFIHNRFNEFDPHF